MVLIKLNMSGKKYFIVNLFILGFHVSLYIPVPFLSELKKHIVLRNVGSNYSRSLEAKLFKENISTAEEDILSERSNCFIFYKNHFSTNDAC